LRGRLERGPEQAGVDALFQRDALRARHVTGQPAERRVVGIAHVRETLVSLRHWPHQRVLEHQIDVVRDEHQDGWAERVADAPRGVGDRKSTRLNSSHDQISYAVFCLKKKKKRVMTCMQ